jgi:hypothetical protein
MQYPPSRREISRPPEYLLAISTILFIIHEKPSVDRLMSDISSSACASKPVDTRITSGLNASNAGNRSLFNNSLYSASPCPGNTGVFRVNP